MKLKVLGLLVWAVVLAVVAIAFLKVGSPSRARLERADEERVADLEKLVRAVRSYHARHHALPKDLTLVYPDSDTSEADLRDPGTGRPYEYRIVDPKTFEVCATFATDQSHAESDGRYPGLEPMPFWKHHAGRQCYAFPARAPKN